MTKEDSPYRAVTLGIVFIITISIIIWGNSCLGGAPEEPDTGEYLLEMDDDKLINPETGEYYQKMEGKILVNPETGEKLLETKEGKLIDPETGEHYQKMGEKVLVNPEAEENHNQETDTK